ncbi:MAG: PKD domain-containing protein [Candidatus Gracilibacteria bacterium]|nr:PKD domain-containing protein [Candidatus Gracilibacteria bacterium]
MSDNSFEGAKLENNNSNDSLDSFIGKLENIEKVDILEDISTIVTEPSLQTEEIKKIVEEKKQHQAENKLEEKSDSSGIIYDININSIDDLIKILLEKSYDFFIVDPNEDFVKISFRKDAIEKEAKYIKFHIYSAFLIKIKTLFSLNFELTNKEQKNEITYKFGNKNLKLIAKTVPSNNGEKIFLKASELVETNETGKNNIVKKSIDFKKAFYFLTTIFSVALIVGSAFLTFVIMNAQTIDDVRFFYQLGINLADINNFLLKLTNIIFPILVFLETILLVIFIFKALITKKENKKQKTRYTILSIFFLIVSFSTLSIWMVVDRKIKELPNWQEEAFGNIQMIDNDKLISGKFDRTESVITDSTNLIGPINIKYDLTRFIKQEEKKGMKISKVYWDFGDDSKQETLNGELIKLFDKVGLFNVKVKLEGTDLDGKLKQIDVPNMPSVNIAANIKIEETKMPNGGKTMTFDASDLKEFGELQWFMEDDLSKPAFIGEVFRPAKVFFDRSLVGLYIKIPGKTDEKLDKVFSISSDSASDIGGAIKYEQDQTNPLKYNLKIEDPKSNFGNGFIKEFKWEIDGDVISRTADVTKLSDSSQISYTFKDFGTNLVKVTIIDSAGKIKEISENINIVKKVTISNKLKITNDGEDVDYKYNPLNNEYLISSLGTPSLIKFDATSVKTDNPIYVLKEVNWDTDGDEKYDKTGREIDLSVNTPGVYNLLAEYTFFRINKKDDEIKVVERININAEEKEYDLSLKLNQDSEYVPAKVSFDASNSKVKGENIVKFAYDYGDGTPIDIRDAINLGHIYTRDGDYTVKLVVTTETGKTYSIEKHVIIKPAQQKVKINLSMKDAPVGQTISFESKDSIGQINNYSWDFGDGEISSEANPSHAYLKAGKYKVTLTLSYANGNELSDGIDVNITE